MTKTTACYEQVTLLNCSLLRSNRRIRTLRTGVSVEVVGVDSSKIDITALLLGVDLNVSTSLCTHLDLARHILTACSFANRQTHT